MYAHTTRTYISSERNRHVLLLQIPSLTFIAPSTDSSHNHWRRVTVTTVIILSAGEGVPSQFSGFVCAYHTATQGSSPKHTIYTFFHLQYLRYICHVKRTKINKKRPGLTQYIFPRFGEMIEHTPFIHPLVMIIFFNEC